MIINIKRNMAPPIAPASITVWWFELAWELEGAGAGARARAGAGAKEGCWTGTSLSNIRPLEGSADARGVGTWGAWEGDEDLSKLKGGAFGGLAGMAGIFRSSLLCTASSDRPTLLEET